MSFFHSFLVTIGIRPNRPTYSREEIAKHNTAESLWIVAGSDVYDVTAYLRSHPGGIAAILKRGGGVADCTRDFNFHSRSARKMMQQFIIGYVGGSGSPSAGSAPSSSRQSAAIARRREGGVASSQHENELVSSATPSPLSSTSSNVYPGADEWALRHRAVVSAPPDLNSHSPATSDEGGLPAASQSAPVAVEGGAGASASPTLLASASPTAAASAEPPICCDDATMDPCSPCYELRKKATGHHGGAQDHRGVPSASANHSGGAE